jgi:outer membrane lipoprotein-sorting protein
MVPIRSHLAGWQVALPRGRKAGAIACGSERAGRADSPAKQQLGFCLRQRAGGYLLLIWLGMVVVAQANDASAVIDRWMAAQTNVQTWAADIIQTRFLKVLTQPLVSTGKVWVAMPDRFRWELGQPAQTIALRQSNQLSIIYPRLKRVEKFPLDGEQTGPWKDALALLDASFPRSRADLESRFRILSVEQTNATVQVGLQPKSEFARRFMTELQIVFHSKDCSPAAAELRFTDGSRMRNEFLHAVPNVPLSDALFETKVEPDFTVVEPARR